MFLVRRQEEEILDSSQRVAVFVDGANFYNRLRQCRWPTSVDVGEFGLRLAGNREFIGAWYYNVSPPAERPREQVARQEAYYARLREHPLVTFTLGFLQRRMVDGKALYEEKGVDVSLAVDMLTGAFEDRYDTAILVSSDGDFKPAVEGVRRYGKRVEYLYFGGSQRSSALFQACNVARKCRRAWVVECSP
ncbi:MAG: NYN domain-containing protein [Chloroflexota bacterium]|nr:NYN domain-containing protein [Chloroflexota bacterium]